MIEIMHKLCEQLDGWNFHYYKNTNKYGDDIYFDFYSNNGDAILTMHALNGKIEIANDVEYYNEKNYTDYESITLEEYNNKLKLEVKSNNG